MQCQGADSDFTQKRRYSSSLPRHPEALQPPSLKATAQGASGFVQLLGCLEGNKEGICLFLNSVSKHSSYKKAGLGRIDLCTILHLPNGLAGNCWMSQMQKGF